MAQDTHRQAIERFEDAKDDVREQYTLMRADMRFSDPTDPQQWDDKAKQLRAGRPCLTFDRTNQFIGQVVNAARQNKPAIKCMPANSGADEAVAEKLEGIVRHIEYVSRAAIAYDTGIEHAARSGLGWIRVVPEIMRPETNEQEIRIKRVHDPLSCYLQAGWSEPDGSDAEHGFIETMLPEAAFKKQWPNAKIAAWEDSEDAWFGDKRVRICEYQYFVDTKSNRIVIDGPDGPMTMTEAEYWQLANQIGQKPPVVRTFEAKLRTVKWAKLSGCEVLEETDFPGQLLGLIPVIGHELWVDGKRHLCGMTRRLMDSQRAYNYERSAFIESVAMQPKAPYIVPFEAIEGFEGDWDKLNQGNPGYLPYNHVSEGEPIPAPVRQMPPTFPAAFAQGGQIASQDMEASVGMNRSNLGQQGTAISGRAKREDKVQGDTANFHYTDNQNRSVEQVGRVVVGMISTVYDTKRQARIVGEDGSHDFVQIDPEMPQAVKREQIRDDEGQTRDGKKIIAINPSVGAYDVRVKAGPAYTTLREESAEQLANMMQAAPQLMPILGDLWVSMQDWPEAEKAAKRLAAMLPPQIQELEKDDGEDIPPQAKAQIAQMQQQIEAMKQALQQAGEEVHQATQAANDKQADTTIKAQTVQNQAQQAEAKAELDRRTLELQYQQAETARIQAEQAANDAQIAKQVELAKSQTDAEQQQRTLQLEAEKINLEAEMEQSRMAHDRAMKQMEIAAEDARSQREDANKILLAEIAAKSAATASAQKAQEGANQAVSKELPAKADPKIDQILTSLQQLGQHMSAPKMIMRDKAGKAIGIQSSVK